MKLTLAVLIALLAAQIDMAAQPQLARKPAASENYQLTISGNYPNYSVAVNPSKPFVVRFNGQIAWDVENRADRRLSVTFGFKGFTCDNGGSPDATVCPVNFTGTTACDASTGMLATGGGTDTVRGKAEKKACNYTGNDPQVDFVNFRMLATPEGADAIEIDPQLQIDRGGRISPLMMLLLVAAVGAAVAVTAYYFLFFRRRADKFQR